jgi:integrase
MRIHRLTQKQCESAMPSEVAVPLTGYALAAVTGQADDWTRGKVVRRARLEQSARIASTKSEQQKADLHATKMWAGAGKEIRNADQLLDENPVVIRNGKPATLQRRTRWLIDGAGLALVVSPGNEPGSVRRSWVFRWNTGDTTIGKSGKARRQQKRIGLGSLATVDLKRARELADQCRLLVKRGQIAERKKAELQLRTLRMAVEDYFHRHSAGWARRHAFNWKRSFDHHLGSILDLPVAQIDRALVIQALTPLWQSQPETGQRLRGRLEKVLAAATAAGWRTGDNPATWKNNLDLAFRPRSHLQPVKHHDALPYVEAPAFMAALRTMDGVKARGLELLILTGVRTAEICSALAEDFDLNAATWTVPAEKTKTGKRTGKSHIVPLSPDAVACLKKVEMKPGQLVFPIHDRALYRLHKQIRKDCSVHGWRSVLATWASEQTDFPREIVEAALDHLVGTDVERRYRRTTWIDKRRMLLTQYADFLSGKDVKAENVVAMRR